MNRVDALLMKVKPPEEGAGLRLTTAFITKDGERWRLAADLWDGEKSSGTKRLISHHDTQDAAEAALEDLRKKHGTHKGAACVTFYEDTLLD